MSKQQLRSLSMFCLAALLATMTPTATQAQGGITCVADVVVQAGAQLAYHAGTNHQLMTDNFSVGGHFFDGRQMELR